MVSPYAGRTAPTGFLLCDGSAVSRTTYAALLAVIAPSGAFTATIASPGVFTKATHGFILGDKVHLTTTGGLPSGLAVNTDYWVSVKDANSFWLFDTKAHAFADNNVGSGTGIIVTTGSQSGVHTVYASNWGKGDGTATFNVPDYRGFTPYGQKTSDANFDSLNVPNTYVGEKTHQLTVAELAAHTHTVARGSTPTLGGVVQGDTTSSAMGTSSTGGDTAHNNMPPYLITVWLIKT
jgi:microcystin-dependent protein